MTVQTSVSKFHWLERPASLPAKCISCGAVNKPVIDFGMSFDRYGAVYFCEDCIGEAARVMGFVKPEEAIAQKLRSEQSTNDYLSSNDLVAVPSGIYADLNDAIDNLSSAVAGIVLHLPMVDAEESPAPEPDSSSDSTGDDSDSVENAGSTKRTSRKRRSDDVSSDTGDDFLAAGISES